jgi:hypothetical protein
MKKIIAVTALTASSFAMAADLKWNVEGRFDFGNTTVKHEQTTATNNYEEKRSEFTSGVLRLNAVYTFNDNLSGRFRYRLSSAQGADDATSSNTTAKNRDLTYSNVDFFYVDHKSEWFTARLGKSNVADSLGRELYMSGTDYPTTMASSLYTTVNSGVYNAIKADADLYNVGASLMFSQIPNGTLTLRLFAPQKTSTYTDTAGVGNDAKNSKLAYGLYFNGNYMNKMLQPTLGYTMFGIAPETPATSSTKVGGNHTLLSVGVKSEVSGVVVEADYKQYKKVNTNTAAAPNDDKTTSIWTNVAYTWDNLTPFVNYVNDKYEKPSATTSNYKRNALTVGLQIKPIKDVNFRYHVAYTNDVKKIDATSGETKTTANQVVAGIKFDI